MTDLVPLLGSGGVFLGALVLLARALPGILSQLSEARLRNAEAKKAEADAELATAEARRVEAETDAMQTSVHAGFLEEMKSAIERAESRARAAESEARALRQWCMRAAGLMRQAGITPPEFPAVVVGSGVQEG